tara:strand:- start:19 stop:285 length:267 start_codon:yes stop_codon:yes gene_type:complete
MLNIWWKEQKPKPITKPAQIKRVVGIAHSAGWSLEDCYEALSVTWAFTERAYETALRRMRESRERQHGNVGSQIIRLRNERKQNESST